MHDLLIDLGEKIEMYDGYMIDIEHWNAAVVLSYLSDTEGRIVASSAFLRLLSLEKPLFNSLTLPIFLENPDALY